MARVKARASVKSKGARSKTKKPVSAKARNRKGNRKPPSAHMVHRVRSRRIHKQTGIEATVEQWLLDADIPYKPEFAISRTHVDFFVPAERGKGTVVEVQGCYFHGCKTKGCNVDGLSARQMRARRRDGRRFTFLRNAGYDLVLIWEHEIKSNPKAAREKLLSHVTR